MPTPDQQFFWDGVARGELLVRECAQCRRLAHPPSPMCPQCGSLDWNTRELAGTGNIMSWIVSKHPTEDDADARIVVLVQLDEGSRLVANMTDTAVDDVRNGMRVRATFAEVDGVHLPMFIPAEEVA